MTADEVLKIKRILSEDRKVIVPDGKRVHVPLMVMDSDPSAAAPAPMAEFMAIAASLWPSAVTDASDPYPTFCRSTCADSGGIYAPAPAPEFQISDAELDHLASAAADARAAMIKGFDDQRAPDRRLT